MSSNILIEYIERREHNKIITIPYGVVRKAELNKIYSHYNAKNVIIAKGNVYEGIEATY